MRLFTDIEGKGTYATAANATKRAQKLCEDFEIDFRFIIAESEDGRFFPVVVLRNAEQHLCGAIAHNGVCVTF